MTRTTYESIANNAILSFSDGLENYGNEIAYVVRNAAEPDLVGYTYKTFEKIDSEFLSICRYLMEIFRDNFKEDIDGDLFDEATDKLDRLKEVIIELKYDVMDAFANATVAS